MNEKTLEQLLAEREPLADKLVLASGGTEKEFYGVCKEVARHFLESIRLVMNPVPEPAAFLAIFALRKFADNLAAQVPGADDIAKDFAELVDVRTTSIKFPRIKKKGENGEEDEE